ncbi:MAG: amidase [Saprospiraceae bacterium]|nr:amidase [Candidatus Opimibacter iunctus]
MNPRTRKILKWTGGILGFLLLTLAAAAFYIWSRMPKPMGKPPVLQTELFQKPDKEFAVDERFISKSATELAMMIRLKQATSLEITQALIHYIRNNNYKTNAFVWLFEDDALEAAKAADLKVASGDSLGSLHGVPVCIKEQFWVKGKPSTWNSSTFQGFVAPRNDKVVEAWLNEGAIILGLTNVPNMLIDLQTHGDLYPTGSNPYDTTRTPGGSTGGGAAAVASGFCPLSLGGDMGGSIRVPSGYCGIYGLKTTEGSMGKDYGSSPDTTGTGKYFVMAVAGPMARTVDDIELGWNAMIKPWYDNNRWLAVAKDKPLAQYKVAYLDEWHFGSDKIPISNTVKQKLATLVDSLKSNGITTEYAEPPYFAEMRQMHMLLMAYMVFAQQPWVIRQLIKHDFESSTPLKIDLSEGVARIGDIDKEEYKKILQRRDALRDSMEQFFKTYDFLILPVAPGPAFVKNPDHLPMDVDGVKMEYWDHFHYAMCFNATGHPALTIPLGLNSDGLPVAVQVVGPMFSEKRLIHFARMIEHLHDGYVSPK